MAISQPKSSPRQWQKPAPGSAAISIGDQQRAAARWAELGYRVRFQPQAGDDQQQQFQYQVVEDSEQSYLLISYPGWFSAEHFYYQNVEAWAAAQGQIGPESTPEQRSWAQVAILSELFTYYRPARDSLQLRVKDYISKLSANTDSQAEQLFFLAPRLAALDAWELLVVIKKLNRQLAQRLVAWRQSFDSNR